MDGNDIIPYIEPIYRFCTHRLSNRCDAEDLASEIICHTLDGIDKYEINSLDGWVWRIAHNRYARFIDTRNKNKSLLTDAELYDFDDSDYCVINEEAVEDRYEDVFRYLHTLSSEYRNILVDYYIGDMSVRKLSARYSLPETTIKWRLNISRQKIRERIGENKMNKIYTRINWNTTICNGSMDSDQYLHTQIARAICQATYEKPLTIEEISLATGIPAMYIEDELPRLEYGDAVVKTGNKYATDFIIFSLKNRTEIETVSNDMISKIADNYENLFNENVNKVGELSFYGHDFGISKLGYILLPYLMRKKIRTVKDGLNLQSGEYPPRKDGGYGWFIIMETADESEACDEYGTGCNTSVDNSGSAGADLLHIYYYWIAKYFENNIYHNGGTRWLCAKSIPENCVGGVIPDGCLTNDEKVRLLENNLIVKDGDLFKLNFACFTQNQFDDFVSLFKSDNKEIDKLIADWVLSVRHQFEKFVPKRLHGQINQWLPCYSGQIIGYVTDELICRGVLQKPNIEKPLVNGVFCVEGQYINP